MGISLNLLLIVNKWFKLPLHPFNLENDKKMTYAEWQYEKGEQTLSFYMERFTRDEMFKDKTVLDIGCGAAGKSLYYVSIGARRVVGLEVLERYRAEADGLARKKGFADRFEYVCADAARTDFAGGAFDTVIMNDAAEHVAAPEAVLCECLRLTAPGGRVYLNFPPYYHPYGAHLSDAVAVPWAHAFFSEKTLIAAYKQLVYGLPDGARRIELRISRDAAGAEHISYINKMTVRRFRKILGALPAKCVYYRDAPLRGVFAPLVKIPGIREFFTKMVVAVLEPMD